MITQLRARYRNNDDGAALLFALLFITLISVLVSFSLQKNYTNTATGLAVQSRGNLQYALDAGVDRAFDRLQLDMQGNLQTPAVSPTLCTTPSATPSQVTDASFTGLNGASVAYTCQDLAGTAFDANSTQQNTNYAIILTSSAHNALTTQSGSQGRSVGGSIYFFNGNNNAIANNAPITISSGDLVANLAGSGGTCPLPMANVTVSAGLQACDSETLAQVLPTAPNLPAAVPTTLTSSVTWNDGGCHVLLPGTYTGTLNLNSGPYFLAGGYYYFNGTNVTINTASVWAGEPNTTTSPASSSKVDVGADTSDACKNETNANVISHIGNFASLPGGYSTSVIGATGSGATFLMGSNATINISGSNSSPGSLTMFSPSSTAQVNVYTIPSTGSGYTAYTYSTARSVVTNGNTNAQMLFNGKIFAASGDVDLFASNNTFEAAYDGVVAQTLTLQASSAAGVNPFLSAPAAIKNPSPPFRTVRIVARDASGKSNAVNTAVAEIANFPTVAGGSDYQVTVLSWRTS